MNNEEEEVPSVLIHYILLTNCDETIWLCVRKCIKNLLTSILMLLPTEISYSNFNYLLVFFT